MFDIDLVNHAPRYTPDSLCQGIVSNPLCSDCTRLASGPRTNNHFVNPPGRSKTCTCYRKLATFGKNIELVELGANQ